MSSIKVKFFLDLPAIFQKLELKRYCVIKLPDAFPSYGIGSDLDVFCYDVQDISKTILSEVQHVISTDLNIEVTGDDNHMHMDVIHGGVIHFRFDLYGALPSYKNVSIKQSFFSSVIEQSSIVDIEGVQIRVPSSIDDCILRYVEYQEWYAKRPDKIKHIEYIERKIIQNKVDIDQMLDKLHYYISIPDVKDDRQVSTSTVIRYMTYQYGNLVKTFRYMEKNGLKSTLLKIKNTVLK